MKIIILFLLNILAQISFAHLKVGFSQSQYQIFNIQGNLYLTCESPIDGRKDYRNLNCQDTRLFPMENDYFWGPIINAESIQLVSHQENGKIVTQVMSYDSQIGRSKKQFQLWRKKNAQDPILSIGSNKIEYFFLLNGQIIDQGEFAVEIQQQQTRQCQSKMQHSYNSNDCIDVWKSCDTYFKQQNYCH